MTTLAELAKQLPWGVHDAHLESMSIDWMRETLTMEMRFPLSAWSPAVAWEWLT